MGCPATWLPISSKASWIPCRFSLPMAAAPPVSGRATPTLIGAPEAGAAAGAAVGFAAGWVAAAAGAVVGALVGFAAGAAVGAALGAAGAHAASTSVRIARLALHGRWMLRMRFTPP